jgi:hypothetical protein
VGLDGPETGQIVVDFLDGDQVEQEIISAMSR